MIPQRKKGNRWIAVDWSGPTHEEQSEEENVTMVWIDYKEIHGIIPQSGIVEYLKLYKISDKIIKFFIEAIKTWKVELTEWGKTFAGVKIQRGILQNDTHLLLLFVISMILHRKCTGCYTFTKSQEKINHHVHERHQVGCKRWKRTGH